MIREAKINVDQVIKLIRKGSEKYSNMQEYVNMLMQRFDMNQDGFIGFEELGEGLKSIDIRISDKEKLALMKALDQDRDGGISEIELYDALAANEKKSNVAKILPGFSQQTISGMGVILSKIRKAVQHYKSMQEQIIGLLRIFDLDNDGLISYLELVDGVKSLGI